MLYKAKTVMRILLYRTNFFVIPYKAKFVISYKTKFIILYRAKAVISYKIKFIKKVVIKILLNVKTKKNENNLKRFSINQKIKKFRTYNAAVKDFIYKKL